jgi:hypothetical protein
MSQEMAVISLSLFWLMIKYVCESRITAVQIVTAFRQRFRRKHAESCIVYHRLL